MARQSETVALMRDGKETEKNITRGLIAGLTLHLITYMRDCARPGDADT